MSQASHVFIAGLENFIISSASSLPPLLPLLLSSPLSPPLSLFSPLSLLQYILSTLALFDWDIFMPRENEKELVDLAEDYDLQKDHNITTVAAGIVFDETSDPERTASVRIRMNSTYIHDTTLIRET